MNRFASIDTLRGIAALIVVWGHFTRNNTPFPPSILKTFALPPEMGVSIFFVISGFILPYSMWRGGYEPAKHIWTFLGKRIRRLDPPYFVAIALGLAVLAAAKWPNYHIDWGMLAMHIGYLNPFFGAQWVTGVFWTLAIEFQFYVLLAIAFPLAAGNSWKFYSFAAACVASSQIFPVREFLPYHWPMFLMGIMAFRYVARKASAGAVIIGLSACASWAAVTISTPEALGAIVTAAAILTTNYSNAATRFFGKISYSLYLTHSHIGVRLVILGLPFATTEPLRLALCLASVAVCIGVAWVMWRFVERPSQVWAGRLEYKEGAD